ncbi:MAG: LysR substrate-binding domain-containing protein [Polyangiales bacterium]
MSSSGLPPLQLLIAFEAAAREGRFKDAARTMCVTPSAVSQQITALEDALGVQLFERRPGSVTLTVAGRSYLETVREALSVLRRGTERVRVAQQRRAIKLSTDAVVAHELLIPALSEFQQDHPQIDLQITVSAAVIDLHREPVDVAVRFGRGPWPSVCTELLAPMTSTLMASPALLSRVPLTCAADLSSHTLIQINGTPDYWSYAADQLGFEPGRRVSFDSYLETMHAAAHGVGVALGLLPLSSGWVQSGKLSAPLAIQWPGAAMHMVYRHEDQGRPELAVVRDWLRARFATLPPCPNPAHA